MFAFIAKSSRIITIILLLHFLTGCANYIFKTFDIDGAGDSLSLGAKQRLVLVTHEGGKTRDRKIVCAEPSPDAFTATSAAASGAITFPGANAGNANATLARGETAASLAMRTQTIQLLRDGYYRACEAYMNGAIDQYQYNIILLNIDKLMIVLLGVDSIAGTRNVAPITIDANANATSAGSADGNKASTTGGKTEIKDIKASSSGSVQAEAIANIVMSANSQTAIPSLCVSLLASGELRVDNPGQRSILRNCDYLLKGAVRKFSHGPATKPRDKYEVSQHAATAATTKPSPGTSGAHSH